MATMDPAFRPNSARTLALCILAFLINTYDGM